MEDLVEKQAEKTKEKTTEEIKKSIKHLQKPIIEILMLRNEMAKIKKVKASDISFEEVRRYQDSEWKTTVNYSKGITIPSLSLISAYVLTGGTMAAGEVVSVTAQAVGTASDMNAVNLVEGAIEMTSEYIYSSVLPEAVQIAKLLDTEGISDEDLDLLFEGVSNPELSTLKNVAKLGGLSVSDLVVQATTDELGARGTGISVAEGLASLRSGEEVLTDEEIEKIYNTISDSIGTTAIHTTENGHTTISMKAGTLFSNVAKIHATKLASRLADGDHIIDTGSILLDTAQQYNHLLQNTAGYVDSAQNFVHIDLGNVLFDVAMGDYRSAISKTVFGQTVGNMVLEGLQ